MSITAERITPKTILRVLVVGFSLVLVLLILACVVGVRNTHSLQVTAARLVIEQNLAVRLINEIQTEQSTLNAVAYQLSYSRGKLDQRRLLADLEETESDFKRIIESAPDRVKAEQWGDLLQAVREFAELARHRIEGSGPADLELLFDRHEAVLDKAAKIVAVSTQEAKALEGRIAQQSSLLINQSIALLGSCLALALFCAWLTVRTTTASLRKLEWQTGELSRVSWHMLEGQEAVARRFSHELHDELGQSLAAVKANLATLQPGNLRERQVDCLQLVDEAISNVRELSQLLRPVILDDFGLDAGLRWLAEKFSLRTGVAVSVDSALSERLGDEAETHLFRIAQEALTNVARHSGASQVSMALQEAGDRVELRISDNGRGLAGERGAGLGLVGMRARASHAGGEMTIHSLNGSGVTIEVWVPRTRPAHDPDPQDAHIARR